MKIDNKITVKRIKKALSPKIAAIILIAVAIASAVLYITLENRDSKELLIWYVTDEAETFLTDEALKLINGYGEEQGLDRVLLSKRNPNDTYFDATMSTTAFYSCDAFIMRADTVQKYIETGMFMTLNYDGEGEILYNGEAAVGIFIYDDYYLLINQKTDVDLQIIYDIYGILTEN